MMRFVDILRIMLILHRMCLVVESSSRGGVSARARQAGQKLEVPAGVAEKGCCGMALV
jgi:hypothetical protein